MHHLALRQTEKGHTVKVIAPVRGVLPKLNYEVLPISPKWPRFATLPGVKEFVFLKRLEEYQKLYNFDIWQVTMGFPFGVAAVDYFNKNNIPCILRCSGEDIQVEPGIKYGARFNKSRDLIIRDKYPKFDGFISIAECMTKEYLDIGIRREDIYYIPNGVNKDLFQGSVDKVAVKKRLGIDLKKKLILTVGRYNPRLPKKGLQFIPDIIAGLAKRRTDFIWLLIGNKHYIIKSEAEKRGVGRFLVADEIRAERREDDELLFPDKSLVDLYRSSDIFAFPSLIEGCSNVITEALASGLPVVSMDVTGVNDIVREGKTGLLSDKGDIEGITSNIDRLLNDNELRGFMKENALDYVKDLDWSRVADRYVGAYEKTISKKRY